MPKETMTGKERWLAVLRRETPDRVPMDFWGTAEAADNLVRHLGAASLDDALARLHVDRPLQIFPPYAGPPLAPGVDEWGVRTENVAYGTGAYCEATNAPLAAFTSPEEIEANYTWPTADWYDFSQIRALVEANPTRPILGGGSEPYLWYCVLRGREQAYMDLMEYPEIVEYCLGKQFDLCHEITARMYEAAGHGNIQISYVAEDLGSQQSLLMSLDDIRRFLLPGMRRMMRLAHEAGAFVFHHSDGAVRPVIPLMIEAGIDALNPIQWRCTGMEREGLKRDFGDRLIFHGAVDNQQTLPFGTAEDVRAEVRDNLRILGEGGGYILAPCHNIQPNTPPENIVAMYEEGYALGWS